MKSYLLLPFLAFGIGCTQPNPNFYNYKNLHQEGTEIAFEVLPLSRAVSCYFVKDDFDWSEYYSNDSVPKGYFKLYKIDLNLAIKLKHIFPSLNDRCSLNTELTKDTLTIYDQPFEMQKLLGESYKQIEPEITDAFIFSDKERKILGIQGLAAQNGVAPPRTRWVLFFDITDTMKIRVIQNLSVYKKISAQETTPYHYIGDFNRDGKIEVCLGKEKYGKIDYDTFKVFTIIGDELVLDKNHQFVLNYDYEKGIVYIDTKRTKWYYDFQEELYKLPPKKREIVYPAWYEYTCR